MRCERGENDLASLSMKATLTFARETRRRSGIVTVWVSITLFALLAIIGLALDTSYVYLTEHQLQNAADAAALAGAAQLQYGAANAVIAAQKAGEDNTAADANVVINGSDVVLGNYNLNKNTFSPGTTPYNAVQVTAHQTTASPAGATINLIFAPIVSALFNAHPPITTSTISESAIAMSALYAGVIVLDPQQSDAVALNGPASLVVFGGVVQVNSDAGSAVSMSAFTSILAKELRIAGYLSAGGFVTLPPQVATGATPIADPLASLSAPAIGPNLGTFKQTIGASRYALVPGYYAGGITLAGKNTLNLSPGIYVLGPPGLSVTGNAILNAPGVMFYLTGSGTSYGTINLGGSAEINVSAPVAGTYANVSFFENRDAPSTTVASITDNAFIDMSGTMYLPSIQLTISGSPNALIANQLIVDLLKITDSNVFINYDDRNPVVSNDVFLVQ